MSDIPPRPGVLGFLASYGPLRIPLAATALISIFLVPAPGAAPAFEGWAMVSTLLAPVLAPLAVMVLLLDALMARVMMAEAGDAARTHYRRVLWTDLGVVAVTLGFWIPYFRGLLP
ncbi:MAG: hypothetical protein EA420_16645 [Candidatus Competibacteraceae bacterium]|jgi:hypothetical protein|nr:MAG: hypothetical protein EA420_16645 [Candidatus Competibacteraceae bacterium]